MADASLSFSVLVDDHTPGLFGDEVRLKEVILNLLSNAQKYSNANGHVNLKAHVGEIGEWIICVEDTGIGIGAEHLDRVLDPFERMEDDPHVRAREGTGLGLSIAKTFMELHGGVLNIESTLGVGTSVSAYFPKERTML